MRSSIRFAYRAAALLPQPKNAAVVLLYHSISDSPLPGTITPDAFRAHVRFLRGADFNIVSLDELAAYRAAGHIPPKTVAITFDDGYRDNYTNAFPVLREYRIPATIFMITSVIGGNWERRPGIHFPMLSAAELQEMAASGLVSIQPHSVHHQHLTQLPESEVKTEVRESVRALTQLLGKPCLHFAYPRGRHNTAVREATARGGARYAYTTLDGFVRPGDDPLQLRRNDMKGDITLADFKSVARFGRITRVRFGA